MYGSGIGTLNVYLNVTNTTSLIWTQNGNKKNQWNNARVTINSAKYFRVNIEAIRGSSQFSDIAIDDIDFVEKSCNLIPDDALPSNQITIPVVTSTRSLRPTTDLDCTFETNFCIWRETINAFDWKRAQGTRGSSFQGPIQYDHTLGVSDGWYIFAGTENANYDDAASIHTDQIFRDTPHCMEFYYYLSTNTKFQFNINRRFSNGGNFYTEPAIWSRTSSQGSFWKLGRVTLHSDANLFGVQIELSNVVNGSLNDKFALDDIYFSTGACQDGSDVNQLCTFTNNTCGYVIDTKTSFQWQLFVPVESDPVSLNDHTTDGKGSGYMFAISNGFKANDLALLTSKLYSPFSTTSLTDAARCLEFYFYLNTDNSIRLDVRANTLLKNLLWSRSTDHGKYWWKGETNVKFLTNYTISFEAVVGTNPLNGFLALDDVILRNGECSRYA